ncbi:MAG: hypothetical protein ACFFBF_16955 [Promethearchaeota archaeon]
MKINGEETFFGEDIKTPEQFIEDLYDRVNMVYEIVRNKDNILEDLLNY